ncbi:MAG: ABC transporter ATP-binding protein [Gemmatimonadetes bacterium]|nr:ABC transporter ATP-binding protein [Gemmatimonadota bacterium]
MDVPAGEVALRARGISKSFVSGGGELRVLKEIDLEVARGEMLAITGASGVGKSTLLHILGTLDRPTSGELEIQSVDVLGLGGDELSDFRNRNIGFVFQFHNLLPEFTALENVMLPGLIAAEGEQGVRGRAVDLLGRVGLEQRLQHRPGELSGGECQRVAVARALIRTPSVVLADEPSGNLDTAASETLHGMMRELARAEGQTFVVMTHDQRLAGGLDRSGSIEGGVFHLN